MKHTLSIYWVGTLTLAVAMAGCASYRPCPGSTCTADNDTTAAVNAALVSDTDLGAPSQIDVSTSDHVVYLRGLVDSEYQKQVAGSVAAQSDGGEQVVNEIAPSN